MNLKDMITLKQAEEVFAIKADTLRAYINKDTVIPKDTVLKVGRDWLISIEWLEGRYKKR